jgi:hypothetical protein
MVYVSSMKNAFKFAALCMMIPAQGCAGRTDFTVQTPIPSTRADHPTSTNPEGFLCVCDSYAEPPRPGKPIVTMDGRQTHLIEGQAAIGQRGALTIITRPKTGEVIDEGEYSSCRFTSLSMEFDGQGRPSGVMQGAARIEIACVNGAVSQRILSKGELKIGRFSFDREGRRLVVAGGTDGHIRHIPVDPTATCTLRIAR